MQQQEINLKKTQIIQLTYWYFYTTFSLNFINKFYEKYKKTWNKQCDHYILLIFLWTTPSDDIHT